MSPPTTMMPWPFGGTPQPPAPGLAPVGTRIRFTRTLTAPANEDHPSLLFATMGDLGTIVGHGTAEGYWVRTDTWPNWFGASPAEVEEVEVIPS